MSNEKTFNDYAQRDDHVIDNEITVTITISEYRSLLRDNAVASFKQSELNSTIYKLRDTVEKLERRLLDQTPNSSEDI